MLILHIYLDIAVYTVYLYGHILQNFTLVMLILH